MTDLYLVRHAHSTYTPDELERPLSERGFSDSQRITRLLSAEEIDIIISSPYRRAIQTVSGIADYLHKEIEIIEDFKERKLSADSVADFQGAISKVWEDPNFYWLGGESNIVAQRRGVKILQLILEKYKDKNIVISTHGNIMVLIMNYFNEKYDLSFWENLDMPDIYKLTFDNEKLIEVERLWSRE